jgi:hypothetical protein
MKRFLALLRRLLSPEKELRLQEARVECRKF